MFLSRVSSHSVVLYWKSANCFLFSIWQINALRLFSNRSQKALTCGLNKKVAHKAIAESFTDVLSTFDVICDLLPNRRTATRNLFYIIKCWWRHFGVSVSVWRGFRWSFEQRVDFILKQLLDYSLDFYFYDNCRNSHALIGSFFMINMRTDTWIWNSCDASARESGKFDNLLS